MLVAAVFLASAAAASANRVLIVSQSGPLGPSSKKVQYFTTIQSAVEASKANDWILVAPGVYNEEVKVGKAHSNIWIRGMDRNNVVLDGQHIGKPGGRNGIEVFKANNVYIENLTVRNFDRANEAGELDQNGGGGNEIWWNGGETGKIGAHGWWGRYLTAYDDDLYGGYGIFTNNMRYGAWENIYASGFNDSGMYLGACPECEARITKAVMENNALGYSGSNSGGNLVIENSVFRHNSDGIAPNSENPSDPPPPQNGACEHVAPYPRNHKLPKFSTTAIARCTIFRNNIVEANDSLTAPVNASTAPSPWGAGIELPGVYGDLVEHNLIKDNPSDGVLAFEYPNPFPPTAQTIYFQLAGNKISDNTFEGNGTQGGAFAGDVMMHGGIFGEQNSTQNCLSGNSFTAATWPENIEGTWGCQNATTPNPNLGFAALFYLLELQGISESRTQAPQPAPGPQESMPEPCEGVPVANPLCENVVVAAARG